MLIRFWILASVFVICAHGQQRADRTTFIPRTEQNSRRVQQRISAIQKIKYAMNQMKMNNMKANEMNNMGTPNMGMNGMASSRSGMNSMGSSQSEMGSPNLGMTQMGPNFMGMDSRGLNMGSNADLTSQSGMSLNGFPNNNPNNNISPLGPAYLYPEQAEAMLAFGALGMNRNIALINVEALENGGLGMMGSGLGGNNRRGQQGQRRRRMKLPLCQPLFECAERFIPPQCQSWRFDTNNGMMCRSCPVNRCEGGAAEFFNTMYEHHPTRIMHSMLTR